MDFFSILLSLMLIYRVGGETEDDPDYLDTCLPQLADRCFKGVMASLVCQIENKNHCSQFGNFCSVATESLQCAADIIDNDCTNGHLNFDSWLRGLRAVKEKVCRNNTELLRVVTETPCFNIEEFVECVEEMIRVTHVLDLLQVSLNNEECNRLLIVLPTCNVRANAAHSMCYLPQEAINDVIYTFFSQTECGLRCPHTSSGLLHRESSFGLLLLTTALSLKLTFV